MVVNVLNNIVIVLIEFAELLLVALWESGFYMYHFYNFIF